MGVSVSRLYSALSSLAFWGKDKEVRILMVGLDSAGKVSKTSLERDEDFKPLRPGGYRRSVTCEELQENTPVLE